MGGKGELLPLFTLVRFFSLLPEAEGKRLLSRTGAGCIEAPWELDQMGELGFEQSTSVSL